MYAGYVESDEKVAARVARRQALHEQAMQQKQQEGEISPSPIQEAVAMKYTKQTLGGLVGRAHMQKLGKAGVAVTGTTYQLIPYGASEYAMSERATGKIIRIIGR
jgi:hypothetical protein